VESAVTSPASVDDDVFEAVAYLDILNRSRRDAIRESRIGVESAVKSTVERDDHGS
jgi:hypothetical protein